MAAATVTGNRFSDVIGNLRMQQYTSVAFAANGDTLTVAGLKTIRSINLTPTTATAHGFTVAGNVITLVSGGAVTFRGSVTGL